VNEPVILWSNARLAICDAQMSVIEQAAILTRGARIEWVGPQHDTPDAARVLDCERRDLQNKWVTPGLVDCHTHLVFAGNRATEWNELLNGVTYEAIARRGGGILSTVAATRQASEQALFEQAAPRLECLLAEGVTAVEVKSGYGLTLENERKMLRAARALERHYPVTIRTTFLAAHALPPEYAGRADRYIDEVANVWLPTLHDEGLIDAVDVFCERIAFDATQAEAVLKAATQRGLPVRMHAEQLSNMGATQLATRYAALSCDHLEYADEDDARAMTRAGTIAVLLPTASLHLRETKLPPVAALRKHDTRLAVASDCNPGSAPSPSLLLAGALATRLFRLTPSEALAGITRNAAHACGLGATHGVLRAGAAADFVTWDVATLDEIFYWIGRNQRRAVVREGRVTIGALEHKQGS
jgi:imidazolonepropionase